MKKPKITFHKLTCREFEGSYNGVNIFGEYKLENKYGGPTVELESCFAGNDFKDWTDDGDHDQQVKWIEDSIQVSGMDAEWERDESLRQGDDIYDNVMER